MALHHLHLITKQLTILVPLLLLIVSSTAIVSERVTIGPSSSSSCRGKLNLCKNMESTADCDKVCPPGAHQPYCTVECNSCRLVCIVHGSAQEGINRREMQEKKGDSSAVVGSSEGGKLREKEKAKGGGKKGKKTSKGKNKKDGNEGKKDDAKKEDVKKEGTGDDQHPK